MEMLSDSTKFAEQDIQARMLVEQQVEVKRVIENLEAALQKDGALLLSESEYQAITDNIKELAVIAQGDDVDAIKDATSSPIHENTYP